ncbi:hypothetical protein EfmJHP35_24760 [Enterococcus faecium]|nr:hypothetical protein EfmJHP35_24760 [Enterococcus faecium]
MAKTTTVTTFDNISIKRISFNFKNATNAISTAYRIRETSSGLC